MRRRGGGEEVDCVRVGVVGVVLDGMGGESGGRAEVGGRLGGEWLLGEWMVSGRLEDGDRLMEGCVHGIVDTPLILTCAASSLCP